jgi:DNA-directed RNA polymerase specialized sigma24 family protein
MFDDLLRWLDPNSEVAAQKYEKIRATLIRIFIAKGFADAEDLTDTTFNRVNKKLPQVGEDYRAKLAYCHGVARHIMQEAWRRKEIATDRVPERPMPVLFTTDRYDCLLECLQLLTPDKRELILDYYLYEGKQKAEHHRQMASELHLTSVALRLRAHHTRRDLEKCVVQCTKNLAEKQKSARKSFLLSHPAGNVKREH